jgi:putative ABC transport system substrate-binding protein
MRRRDFITLIGSTAACSLLLPLVARAQRAHKIGALFWGLGRTLRKRQPHVIAFRQGLEDLGWKEGHDLDIEFRWIRRTDGENDVQVAELLALAPDLIVTESPAAVSILRRQTRTIPMLFVLVPKPEMDAAHAYREAAFYADRILKGTNSADLLMQIPPKHEFINQPQGPEQDCPHCAIDIAGTS